MEFSLQYQLYVGFEDLYVWLITSAPENVFVPGHLLFYQIVPYRIIAYGLVLFAS